jgi:hypothetical protein
MVELERSKCMVKARCYAKSLPSSFGGSAFSFSGNYGFYVEIPDLMAQGGENVVSSHPDKEAIKEKLPHGVSERQPFLKMALVLPNNGFRRLTDDMNRQQEWNAIIGSCHLFLLLWELSNGWIR